MTENVQELIAEARRIAVLCPRSDASAAFLGLVAALEAAALTSDEDQMYVRRMEAERDAALAIVTELVTLLPGVLSVAEDALKYVHNEWSTTEWPGDDEDYAAINALRAVLNKATK